jgi:Cu(I)/Ag(I) efflux system membrane protein CusA/SilA
MATRKDEGDVVAEMDRAMDIIGYVNTWVQPIRARVMMQSTGIQTPVGIKVKGPDIAVIEDLSQQIENCCIPQRNKVCPRRAHFEGYYIEFTTIWSAWQANVTIEEAMDTVRYAIGGDNIVTIKRANGATVPLSVQYHRSTSIRWKR